MKSNSSNKIPKKFHRWIFSFIWKMELPSWKHFFFKSPSLFSSTNFHLKITITTNRIKHTNTSWFYFFCFVSSAKHIKSLVFFLIFASAFRPVFSVLLMLAPIPHKQIESSFKKMENTSKSYTKFGMFSENGSIVDFIS